MLCDVLYHHLDSNHNDNANKTSCDSVRVSTGSWQLCELCECRGASLTQGHPHVCVRVWALIAKVSRSGVSQAWWLL